MRCSAYFVFALGIPFVCLVTHLRTEHFIHVDKFVVVKNLLGCFISKKLKFISYSISYALVKYKMDQRGLTNLIKCLR